MADDGLMESTHHADDEWPIAVVVPIESLWYEAAHRDGDDRG